MATPDPIDKLIGDILLISKESSGLNDLLAKSGQRMKAAFKADEVLTRETVSRNQPISQAAESVLSNGKPYVDNRLSDYSSFPELIGLFKSGWKSCAMVPIIAEGRGLGLITLISKGEDSFGKSEQESMAILANVISSEAYVKLEKEKSLSVARYFDAAFNSILPQALIDSAGLIMKANKGLLNLIDKPVKDMPGKNLAEFFSLGAEELTSLSKGRPVEVKSSLYPDRIFLMTSSKVSERLMHVLIQDETEAVELEEKAQLFDYGEEVYALLNKDMKIVWISSNTERVFRVDSDALTGLKLQDIVVNPEQMQQQMRAIDDKGIMRRERLNLGNDLFADVKLTILKNDLGYSCIIISDYERKISAAQRFADDFAQLSGDLVIKMDKLGSISGINKAAEKLLGYKSQELEGMPISTLCTDTESQSRLGEAFPIIKRNGRITGMFITMVGKNRTDQIPLDMSILNLADEAGKQVGYIALGQQLLDKRLIDDLESRLENVARQAEKLKSESDLKTQFIYNISHDLKTPLTSIKGYSKLMLQGEFGAVTEEERSALETINGEVDRLMGLILQILDVAKLASGKIKLDIQQVSFKEVEENASIKALGERAKNQGVEFNIRIGENVPEVPADPNRLIQVFVNLVDNALKFTEKGSINVDITRKGKYARVEIIDTGIGIKDEDRAKLFRKFYQVSRKDLTMQPKAGTGLGLSIVKEIVQLHGGRIGVTSEYGKGSTFWFTIPLEKKKKKAPEEPQSG